MYGQIGSWDEGLSVTFDDKALTWLDAQGTDRHVTVDLDFSPTDGRRDVIVSPVRKGVRGETKTRKVSNRGPSAHSDYDHGATWDWDQVNGQLSRFELCEVKFKPVDDGHTEWLTLSLPLLHLLPWPKLRECSAYDLPREIVRELEARMKSARDAAGDLPPSKWHMLPLPDRLRSAISREAYAGCLRAVIAGEAYAEAA